jgi:hypothetical protein
MRDAIIVGFIIGAFFAAIGAIVAALAIKNATPSLLWDLVLWGGVAMLLCSVATLALYISSLNSGRLLLWPALLINTGLCLIVGGFVWHVAKVTIDNDYMFFWVDILEPENIPAQLPIYIASPSSGSFRDLRVWWAPWGSDKKIYPETPDNPYWSMGFQMKSPIDLIRGGAKYGRSIPAGDYIVEYDATLRDINYHFDEHLLIENENGKLAQKINVWRTVVPGGEKTLVYSGGRP